jgi:hypothetical protein
VALLGGLVGDLLPAPALRLGLAALQAHRGPRALHRHEARRPQLRDLLDDEWQLLAFGQALVERQAQALGRTVRQALEDLARRLTGLHTQRHAVLSARAVKDDELLAGPQAQHMAQVVGPALRQRHMGRREAGGGKVEALWHRLSAGCHAAPALPLV